MTDDFYYNVEFYKQGLYDLISWTDKITGEPFAFHPKQIEAIKLLNDQTTSYVGYGGSARGGKSALIAADAILSCHAYPMTVNMIGRKKLTTLWETTWKTLLRLLDNFGFVLDVDYKYNGKYHELTFIESGSMITAKNLELKPSDQEGTEYGSLEILRAYIDQAEHVDLKIIEKIGERAGSHFTAMEYGLKGKVFECFNPSANHTKRRYWLPFRDGIEKVTRKFVRALPSDNPGREAKEWVKQRELEFKDGTMSKQEYEKQILGNFDYDDNPDRLCSYDSIVAMFDNDHLDIRQNKRYITCDAARLGSDMCRIGVWDDFDLVEVISLPISRIPDIIHAINSLRSKYNIPKYHVIVDEDGVGGGVVDAGYKGFVNGSTPIKEDLGLNKERPQYKNLQNQCGYKLGHRIANDGIYISAELSTKDREEIIQECEQLISWKVDDDQKLKLKPKSEIKQSIGRSPDWRDMMLMREWFELKKPVMKAATTTRRK